MKIYRLLRNNKETGPYTLEELTANGLKLYDLVWVDGKSAAWRYPSEINDLKAFAPGSEEQPFDQFFKQKKATTQTIAEVQEQKSEPVKAGIKQKPRFKVTAASSKIETANQQPVPKPLADVNPAHYDYLPRRTATQTKQVYEVKTPAITSVPLETKYQRSLEDIKQEYTATVLASKSKKKNFRYAWLAIIPVFVVGIVLGISFTKKSSPENVALTPQVIKKTPAVTNATNVLTSAEPVVKQEEIKPETLVTEQEVPQEKKPEAKKASEKVDDQQERLAEISPKKKKDATKETLTTRQGKKDAKKTSNKTLASAEKQKAPPVTASKKAQAAPEKKEPAYNPEIVLTRPTGNETGRTVKINTNRINGPEQKSQQSEEKVADKKITAAPAAKTNKKSMDDYVVVDGNYNRPAGGIKDITLNVQNVTSYPLDMVVVDLEYFDRSGRLLKGETLYVHDLQPRQNVTVNAPDGNATARLGYKVSMVSSQRAGVHLIAD